MAGGSSQPDWVWDELVLACDLLASNDWRALDNDHPEVKALSSLMASLPLHPGGGITRTGIRRKLSNLKSCHPDHSGAATKGGRLDRKVVERFVAAPAEMHGIADAIRSGKFDDVAPPLVEYPKDVGATEGRLLVRQHLVRERNGKLRQNKIKDHLARGGKIACQVCEFDFGRTYGAIGQGYIECHHVVPLSASGTTTTRLDQLALLCANCHRMIHRSDAWLTPDELKAALLR